MRNKSRAASQSPQDTLKQLSRIFPAFGGWWSQENGPQQDGFVDGVYFELTHHHVMREFLDYFGRHHAQFTQQQLSALGRWLSEAVARLDALENAVSTCFLEHMRQVRINRILAPYLSQQAKGKAAT